MDRNEARKAAEIMLAYADGKDIEFLSDDGWEVASNPDFNWGDEATFYRIKSSSTYRPFKNAEECWQEMQKHQPFGWITKGMKLYAIKVIECNTVFIDDGCENRSLIGYFKDSFTFADGTPFGIIENNEVCLGTGN